MGRFPWITAAIVGAALLIGSAPRLADALEYDRQAVRDGGFWRLLTGQLTHWTPRMMAADLIVVAAAGAWLETRSRRLHAITLGAGAVLVGAGVHMLDADLGRYRGSSGLASALFVAAAIDLGRRLPPGRARGLTIGLLALFAAKVALESWTGRALAAGAFPPGVSVAPVAHLMGACAGVLAGGIAALAGEWPPARPEPS